MIQKAVAVVKAEVAMPVVAGRWRPSTFGIGSHYRLRGPLHDHPSVLVPLHSTGHLNHRSLFRLFSVVFAIIKRCIVSGRSQ